MREERSGIEQFALVQRLPLIRRAIRTKALGGQRMRRRPEPEDVEQQSFVVPLVPMRDEPGLRPPAMGQCGPAVPGPAPVSAAVERVSEASDLHFVRRIAVEIGGDGQRAGEQERRVDGGKLALPDAPARFDVQEMIEEPLVPGGVGLRTLWALEQIPQPFQRDLGGEVPEEHTTLDHDRDGGQRHPDGGNADRSPRVRLVAHQPVIRVGLVQVVQHRRELQQAEVLVGERPTETLVDIQVGRHAVALVSPGARWPRASASHRAATAPR